MKGLFLILGSVFLCSGFPYILALALPTRKWLVLYATLAIVFCLYILAYNQSKEFQNDFSRPVGVDISLGVLYSICLAAVIGVIAKLKYITLKSHNQTISIIQNPMFIGIFLVPLFAIEQYFIGLVILLYFLYLIVRKKPQI